jgi:20S proteasome alpha/beta subunit
LIIIGSDKAGNHIYQLDPRGVILSGKAMAIGKNSESASETLRAEYKPSMTVKEAMDLALKALSKAEEKESPVEVGIAVGDSFKKMSLSEARALYP